jgi:hypothetical protein
VSGSPVADRDVVRCVGWSVIGNGAARLVAASWQSYVPPGRAADVVLACLDRACMVVRDLDDTPARRASCVERGQRGKRGRRCNQFSFLQLRSLARIMCAGAVNDLWAERLPARCGGVHHWCSRAAVVRCPLSMAYNQRCTTPRRHAARNAAPWALWLKGVRRLERAEIGRTFPRADLEQTVDDR